MNVYAVILSGGAGRRLWPLSTSEVPKQFHNLAGKRSLLEEALSRAHECFGQAATWVVTSAPYGEKIKNMGVVNEKHIIEEPLPRNTAAAIALAAACIPMDNADVLVVMPSDHFIEPLESFKSDVKKAVALAADGFIVIFGIKPSFPSQAFGYIVPGEEVSHGGRTVKYFKEKPELNEAQQLIENGALWNSGIFVMRKDTLAQSFEKFMPQLFELMMKCNSSSLSELSKEELEAIYSSLPPVPFDRGILEHSRNVGVLEASFKWSDLGTWDAVCDLNAKSLR